MSGDVKRVRGARTRETRAKIVTAAAERFIADGYHATTLEQIAAQAGVAVQTVYFHFGNKRTVLKEAVDVAAVGDDDPVALLERPWLEEARAQSNPRRVLELWTSNGRSVLTRVGPIMRVVRDAAIVDTEMAEQWATNEAQTATAFGILAKQLDAMDTLRVPVGQATDILCAISGLSMFLVLSDRGWTPAQWESFVVDVLSHTLLGPTVDTPS
ncbi:TetR/AcrR family transcriptional regulator [Gordonia sp. ABSL11-1]|uniref:TetR/AcrR family transcriptional regulator n=1 Tax=Gordonia sp. ABSL11-1 TaxID=3053924 RepID=UPI002573D86A|nr:TetR/AcrR family transcriptional regulator [Gordonia sp. ABSL11-1]MDL9947643.1 TetR/AcrR family transcriptional regulator [Gordonia sp. ABSL11-1]